jgi:hypothetical protein
LCQGYLLIFIGHEFGGFVGMDAGRCPDIVLAGGKINRPLTVFHCRTHSHYPVDASRGGGLQNPGGVRQETVKMRVAMAINQIHGFVIF